MSRELAWAPDPDKRMSGRALLHVYQTKGKRALVRAALRGRTKEKAREVVKRIIGAKVAKNNAEAEAHAKAVAEATKDTRKKAPRRLKAASAGKKGTKAPKKGSEAPERPGGRYEKRPPPLTVEYAAARMGLDLNRECPVCRSMDPCECDENDRAFIRRTRFENNATKVPRCKRCHTPLSVLYVPRPGVQALTGLSCFTAIYACAFHGGDALQIVLRALDPMVEIDEFDRAREIVRQVEERKAKKEGKHG